MTTVLIADDHQLLRQALRRAMEDAGLVVLGEASDGAEAVQLVDQLRPELVIMDVTMPVLGGIEATRRLHAAHPDLPIVVLTMHDEEALREEALRAGASAFLTKDSSMQEVVATAIATAAGEALSAELASSILSELASAEPVVATEPSPLTRREEEILQLIADGYSTSEVAARLFISGKTVKNHLASVYDKLDARDRTQAVLSAVRIGIIHLN
ncbi:MAG: two-component system, NarL family, response regulator DegU [Actinomycetota bacterium]|jgi:DNA-binding NarL/FixJ family response regulator|nr:two-component system, NarL family, response regulator DegU [Actinomycetota bacterium]